MKRAVALVLSCCLVQPLMAADDAHHPASGVVVYLGSGELSGTFSLNVGGGEYCIVQGLEISPDAAAAAWEKIDPAKLSGRVTVRTFDGTHLPYVDNMVNVLVVHNPFSVSREEMIRVLCPGGSLCVMKDGIPQLSGAPVPETLDEWTHYHYDAAGTMVSRDEVVGPPRHMQWVGGPKWLRNHEFMSSMHAMVSSAGRVFYIIDEGLRNHIFLPPKWTLIARDAFNGTILWKRPIPDWQPHFWPMKSGPGHMPRRLVAVGGTVYVTLGFNEPTTAIDGLTGEILRTYDGTKGTEEILLDDGTLYLLVDPDKRPIGFTEATTSWGKSKSRANELWGWTTERSKRTVIAADADSGEILWKYTSNVAPLTLTKGPRHVYLYNGESVVAIDPTSGKEAWRSEIAKAKAVLGTGYTNRLVYSDGLVVLCTGGGLTTMSALDGSVQWRGKLPGTGHMSPNDLFVINGQVWAAETGKAQSGGTLYRAIDLQSGEVAEEFVAETPDVYFMHQRCYPGRATERFIMTSGTGTEFLELGTQTCEIHHYVRGSCIYGIMPTYGMMIKPPDSCACHYQSKVTNLCALAPAGRDLRLDEAEANRLEQGPGYGAVIFDSSYTEAGPWSTYRANAARSGAARSVVSSDIKPAWETQLDGKLSAATIGYGKAFVAAVDRGTLYALDIESGKVAWKFTAGSRIDSPPTVYQRTVLFGSADGWVYCVRVADGQLAWRFRAAPGEQQIVSYGQLESLWPVHGSVLVVDDTLYCVAGRNMFFDEGMRMIRLDAKTGDLISETVLNDIDPETGESLQLKMPGKAMPVANPDILSYDGQYIYMGAQKFGLDGRRIDIDAPKDKESIQVGEGRHLFCPTGLLDDAWFHRSYMMYGLTGGEGHGEYVTPTKTTPAGRLLVYDDEQVYGFRATVYENTMQPRPEHFLFSADRHVSEEAGNAKQPGLNYQWIRETPSLLPNAMALAGKTLFLAGAPDVADEGAAFGQDLDADSHITRSLRAQEDAWQGGQGALLWAVDVAEGVQPKQYQLDAIPVWDGMAVTDGKLLMVLKNGKVVCWGP